MNLARAPLEQPLPPPSVPERSVEELSSLEADRLAEEERARAEAQRPAAAPKAFLSDLPPAPIAEAPDVSPTDPLFVDVKKILETGLEKLVSGLPPEAQASFATAGQDLAGRIVAIHARLRAEAAKPAVVRWFLRRLPWHPTLDSRHMVHWIGRWMSRMPGTSKYFLAQAAKIAADTVEARLNKADMPT